jgi:hypothetical protein
MDVKELCERLTELTRDFPAVTGIRIDPKNDDKVVLLEVLDFRPNQKENPWHIYAMYNDGWTNEAFKISQPCIELLVPLGKIDPSSASYYNQVAKVSLPWVDHQRLFPGASFRWDPDTGDIRVYAQICDYGQPREFLDKALKGGLFNLVGLIYHATLKTWAMDVHSSLGETGAAIIQQVGDQMNALLNIPESEKAEEDSID